jgi:hypothetical protein
MAKKRDKQSSRRYDVADLVDLVGALQNIRNGNGAPHAAVLTDPSVNVKGEMELRATYEKEIRDKNEEWQRRFDSERQRANDAKAEKESGRVDSRFAELSTQALTLVNTVATTAKAASDAVAAAALQQTEAMNQMREIVGTLGTTVTSLVAAGGGERSQRNENRQVNQWTIGLAIVVAGIIIGAIIKLLP